jgi:hypothetical protein
MQNKHTLGSFVLLLMLAALVVASTARAESGDYGTGTLVTQATVEKTAPACSTVTAWRGFKLLVGIMAWKYFARIQWCWNGKKITAFGYRRWAEVYVPTWDFKGHIGKSGYGGVGTVYARRWTQGKFQQCAAWCVQTKTPWVELVVTRKGAAKWNAGG